MRSINSTGLVLAACLLVAVATEGIGRAATAEELGFDGEVTPLAEPLLLRYQPTAVLLKTTSLTFEASAPNQEIRRSFEKESGAVRRSGDALIWKLAGWRNLTGPDDPKDYSLNIEFSTDDMGALQFYALVEVDTDTSSVVRKFVATEPEILPQLVTGYPILPEQPVVQGYELELDRVFVELLGHVGVLAEATQLRLDRVEDLKSTAVGTATVDGKECLIFEVSGTVPIFLDGIAFDITASGYRAFDLATGFVLLSDLTLTATSIDGSGNDFQFNAVTTVTIE